MFTAEVRAIAPVGHHPARSTSTTLGRRFKR
jgi:hypothetical protein